MHRGADDIGGDAQAHDAEFRYRPLKLAHHEKGRVIVGVKLLARAVCGFSLMQFPQGKFGGVDGVDHRQQLMNIVVSD
ncbi:hypothetical protein D3C83_71020 [compost metagenome]